MSREHLVITRRLASQDATPVSGTSPGTGGPFGAAHIARSVNPTALSHQLVPDLGTLWAETEVSAPVAGIPTLHLAGHIDNILSIAPGKPLDPAASPPYCGWGERFGKSRQGLDSLRLEEPTWQ